MDNNEWEAFVAAMEEDIRKQYEEGSGGELKEWRKDGSFYPPKMASYGSSSRMIYFLSQGIPEFCFEKKLKTTVGGQANLDGYLQGQGVRFYIEAKHRGPYSTKRDTEVSVKYKELYDHFKDKVTGFDYVNREPKDGYMRVTFVVDGEALSHFDLKQMICHLLGIATERLQSQTEEEIRFLYVIV